MLLLSSADLFFQNYFFQKNLSETQGVKRFGPKSGPTFCRSWSGSKLFAKVINRRQRSPLARKELCIRFAASSCCCSANFYLAFFIFRNLYQKQCIEFVINMLEPCGSPVTSLATVVMWGDSLQQKREYFINLCYNAGPALALSCWDG